MLTVKLPTDMENRLEAVATRLGRSKHDVALEAILEEIQDLEDGLVALQRMECGDAEFYSIDEVRARLGLNRPS